VLEKIEMDIRQAKQGFDENVERLDQTISDKFKRLVSVDVDM